MTTLEQGTFIEAAALPRGSVMMIDVRMFPPDEELEGDPPDAEFQASIMQYGVLMPVSVLLAEGGYRVLDGRNRIKALRRALDQWDKGLRKWRGRPIAEPSPIMGATVYTEMDDYLAHTLTLVANEQRRRNPASDLTAIEALLRSGHTEEEIRFRTGMSASTMRQRLGLLRLNSTLREHLREGEISCNFAEAAAKLPASMQDRLCARLDGGATATLKLIGGIKRVQSDAAVAELPQSLWSPEEIESTAPDPTLAMLGRFRDDAERVLLAFPTNAHTKPFKKAVGAALEALTQLDATKLGVEE
jgi:hypothetical protein